MMTFAQEREHVTGITDQFESLQKIPSTSWRRSDVFIIGIDGMRIRTTAKKLIKHNFLYYNFPFGPGLTDYEQLLIILFIFENAELV